MFQSGGKLYLYNLSRPDSALYICLVPTQSAEAKRIDNQEARMFENVDGTFIESMKVRLIVRSVPCAVTRLTMRISTILGVLIWEYNRNTTYSHPLKSFTAEFRMYNNTWPAPWERLDPINISPNVVSEEAQFKGKEEVLEILICYCPYRDISKSTTCCRTRRTSFAFGRTILLDRAKSCPRLSQRCPKSAIMVNVYLNELTNNGQQSRLH